MIDRFYKYDIMLQKKTVTENGFGGFVETWSNYMTIFGTIRPLSGSEQFSANKIVLNSTHRLYCDIEHEIYFYDTINMDSENTIEEKTGINRSLRLKYKDDIYNIIFVYNPMNMDKFLQVDLELKGYE